MNTRTNPTAGQAMQWLYQPAAQWQFYAISPAGVALADGFALAPFHLSGRDVRRKLAAVYGTTLRFVSVTPVPRAVRVLEPLQIRQDFTK